MKNKVIILFIVFILLSGCKHRNQLESWLGKYYFFEWSPSASNTTNMIINYEIEIYENNGQYYADINIDGWMTCAGYTAIIQGSSQSIDLIFDSYLPENTSALYDKGDVLLTFTLKDNTILTHWKELEPRLLIYDNSKSGGVYFVKETFITANE